MTTQWFLGANSGAGFYSLYDSFASGRGDFLHVIKGGPGTGKSGFMRRIGAAAEKAGLDVEYIRCSGDPDSLDGIYLPQRKTAWADGTAPHTLDPAIFGVTGGYIDLGAFCDAEGVRGRGGEIRELTSRYKEKYALAYSRLRAAAACGRRPGLITDEDRRAAESRARSMAARELPKAARGGEPGRVTRRFLSALTCQGPVTLEGTVAALCSRVALLDDRCGLAGPFLDAMLSEAVSRGVDAVLCPSPLTPSEPEAVLLPELSLGFLISDRERETRLQPWRRLRLDAIPDAARLRSQRRALRSDEKTRRALLDSAAEALAEAKALHDELEALYNPHVDFQSVRAAADREIARVTAP